MRKHKRNYTQVLRPGLFYGTAKVHKLIKGEGLKEMTLQFIMSNRATVIYTTVKYLSTLLMSVLNFVGHMPLWVL